MTYNVFGGTLNSTLLLLTVYLFIYEFTVEQNDKKYKARNAIHKIKYANCKTSRPTLTLIDAFITRQP